MGRWACGSRLSEQRESADQAVQRADAVFVLIDPAYASRYRFVEVSKETALRFVQRTRRIELQPAALNIPLQSRYGVAMSNVIRPTFGARLKPDEAPPAVASITELRAVRHFGQAAGYDVAMVRDEQTKQGPVFKVVVGPSDGREFEAFAILPDTREGEADAEVVGMAILRTLELMETIGRGPESA